MSQAIHKDVGDFKGEARQKFGDYLYDRGVVDQDQREAIEQENNFLMDLAIEHDLNPLDGDKWMKKLFKKIRDTKDQELESLINIILDESDTPVTKKEKAIQEIGEAFENARAENNGKKPRTGEIAFICRKEILEKYHIINTKDNEKLWIYDNDTGLWRPEAKNLIREILTEALEEDFSTHIKNETIEQIRGSTTEEREIFGVPEDHIAVENGLFDLENDELKEFRPEHYTIQKIPQEYDPEAECPKIDGFINDVVDTEKKVKTLYEFVGHAISPSHPIQKALMLTGENDNGKSVFLNLIKDFLGGRKNVSSESFQDLNEYRFSKANLHQKFANIRGDLSGKSIKSTGNFKELTGGDKWIKAHVKNEKGFEFNNKATLMFSANNIPGTKYDKTDAFYKRWIIMKFPYRFVEEPEGMNEKKRDPNILEKIESKEEFSGLLNKAIEGLQRLRENGHFSINQRAPEIREIYETASNKYKKFYKECLKEAEDGYVTRKHVHKVFEEWCSEENMPTERQGDLTKDLDKEIPEIKQIDKRIGEVKQSGADKGNRKTVGCWKGCYIKEEWANKIPEVVPESPTPESLQNNTSDPSDPSDLNIERKIVGSNNTNENQNRTDQADHEIESQKERMNKLRDLISDGVEQEELLEKVEEKNLYSDPIETKLLKDLKRLKSNQDIINPKPEYYEVV